MKSWIRYFVFFICLNIFPQNNVVSYEQETIGLFKKDSVNYDFIANLSIIDSTVTKQNVKHYKSRLHKLIKDLPPKENKANREKKRIKKIYDIVHNSLFKKYEDVAYFPQIFSNGVYNCVTATSIYAYIFDVLDISYVIKEAPGHVFLIAYPNSFKIHLETTAPGVYGFISPKDSDIKKIVDNLIKFKLITKEEVVSKGNSKIYMDYFYGEDFLDKKALIGMQFYNKGLKQFSTNDYKNAEININKSLIYYDYLPSKYLNKSLVFLNLENFKFDKLSQVEKLFFAFSILEYGKDFNNSDIKYFFYKIIDNDENDLTFIESSLEILSQFDDKDLNKESKIFFYEHLLRVNLKNDELGEAIRLSDSILKLNPKNRLAKEGINYSVGKKVTLLPFTDDVLDKVNKLTFRYDFLKENKQIVTYKAYLFGRFIEDSFKTDKLIIGEKHIEDLDTLIYSHREKIFVNSEVLSMIYSNAGRYYYRHNKFKKALEVLNKGLKIYPESKEIKKIIVWVKEEINGKY